MSSFVISKQAPNLEAFCVRNFSNELGWIRRDQVASFIDAVEVEEDQCDDCCPQLVSHCLKLPVRLDCNASCLTTPLVDCKTCEPFKVKQGCLIDQIIIAKCCNACLDPDVCFILGTIGSDGSCDAQKWISESQAVTGKLLNKCCFVKVDAAFKCKEIDLELCGAQATPDCNGCKGNSNVTKSVKGKSVKGGKISAKALRPVEEEEEEECEECEDDPALCVTKTPPNCGSLTDTCIGLTTLGGTLDPEDITVTIKCYEVKCPTNCECPTKAFGSCGKSCPAGGSLSCCR